MDQKPKPTISSRNPTKGEGEEGTKWGEEEADAIEEAESDLLHDMIRGNKSGLLASIEIEGLLSFSYFSLK